MRARCLLPGLVVALLPLGALAQDPDISNVYPTAMERAILFVTNEVRNEPAPWPTPAQEGYATWECKDSEPESLPPLEFNWDLARAARYHADDMFLHRPFFEHESYDGTSFSTRVARFYPGGSAGENIAKGQAGPVDVLQSWMTSPGHRCNILSPGWNELGTGYAAEDNGSDPHYVQDFGARGGVSIGRLPAGIALQRANKRYRFAVNYYDPSERPPKVIQLVLERGCTDLDLAAGLMHQGTWDWEGETEGHLVDAYWFLAVDADDEVATYPAEGALYTPIPMHLDDRREERPLPDCAAELVPAEPPEDEEPDTGGGGGGGGRSRRNQGCQAAPTGGGPAALPTRLLRR